MKRDDPRRGARGVCWSCGSVNDDVMGVGPGHDPAGPVIKAGDCSVCAYCAALAIFTGDGLAVRIPTRDEQAQAFTDPTIRAAVRAALALAVVSPGPPRYPGPR